MTQGGINLKQGDTIKGHWCTDTNGDMGFAPCDKNLWTDQFEWNWIQGKIETDDYRCNVSEPQPQPNRNRNLPCQGNFVSKLNCCANK